jgi:hypothetical protein
MDYTRPKSDKSFDYCFCHNLRIKELSFESESSVRESHFQVFAWCPSLPMIVIPASLRKMDGSAFMGSEAIWIEVASNS